MQIRAQFSLNFQWGWRTSGDGASWLTCLYAFFDVDVVGVPCGFELLVNHPASFVCVEECWRTSRGGTSWLTFLYVF